MAHKPGSGVNRDVFFNLIPKRQACIANVSELKKMGAIKSIRASARAGAVWVSYEERVWQRLPYDDKARQALLVYCANMPEDGRLTVMVEGYYSGKTIGSVVNGHYSGE